MTDVSAVRKLAEATALCSRGFNHRAGAAAADVDLRKQARAWSGGFEAYDADVEAALRAELAARWAELEEHLGACTVCRPRPPKRPRSRGRRRAWGL